MTQKKKKKKKQKQSTPLLSQAAFSAPILISLDQNATTGHPSSLTVTALHIQVNESSKFLQNEMKVNQTTDLKAIHHSTIN